MRTDFFAGALALWIGAGLHAAAAQPAPPPAGEATEATRAANAALAARLPLDEPTDLRDARRGLLAQIEGEAILAADGSVVWSIPQFDFLEAPAPDTVNPSLWRQSQLAAIHGLFEVADGLWQVRGYDLAVMSIIKGETGWIIVDPLTAVETAAAALKLVNDTLGARPVTGVLYTHSHADHFGGARGVITEEDIAARNVPVIAPEGFSEHAVAENLLAGNHMSRRAVLMFGNTLPRSAQGHVGSGLGPGLPQGTVSLVLPTEEVPHEGMTRVIDGVTFEFIDAAGTEAPAEFMFYLPQMRALCTAEVASGTFHNALTLRGAKARDTLGWARVIDKVLKDYGAKSDVVFASHHWPTWGTANVQAYLRGQRDIYRYVHDQTLRLANGGKTLHEVAEALGEPAFTADAFHTRGYYGTLNHNAKAVYQYYFGWWNGVPADFHRLPHEDSAARYVAAMGGLEATLAKGAEAFAAGDYRWAAELFNHVVFAEPDNAAGRAWLASAYEQMGFQAESGAWRSYYLTAARELRDGVPDTGATRLGNAEFLKAVPTLDLFDAMASRFNPAKLRGEPFALNFRFTDTDETIALFVGPSVVVPRSVPAEKPAATVTMTRASFDAVVLGEAQVPMLVAGGDLKITGNPAALGAFLLSLDRPKFWFNVVTP